MADPVRVLREMRRVVKPGRIMAALDVDYAASRRRSTELISRAWREWADSDTGWLAMPHGEVIARA